MEGQRRIADSPARRSAEERLRERIAREEQRRSLRRKRTGAAAVVVLAFVVAFLGAWLARPRTPKASAGSRVARVSPSAPLAQPTVTVIPEEPPAAEPASKPAPKPKATSARRKGSSSRKPKVLVRSLPAAEPERVRIAIGAQGYEPSVVRVKANARLKITVGKGEGCAAGFLMPDLGIEKDNSAGSVTFTVGPLERGTYRFTCGMQMVTGTLVAQ